MRRFTATYTVHFEFPDEEEWTDEDIETHIDESLWDQQVEADDYDVKEVFDEGR